ncbi:MAG: alkaline phosphatase family protein [Planctomycetes bacterium]|nr:alkaline phosphatase family protein [Planctomycetota bacterium]
MRIPRWAVYPALAVLAVFLIPAIPARKRTVTIEAPVTGATKFPRVVVLGIDGMDPDVLREVIAQHPERMTNFRRLIDEGGLHELGTSTPPQSPVAWSNFITGMNPGGHGIYDFIHRDPMTREPFVATTKLTAGSAIPFVMGYQFPIGGGSESNRTGKPFWQILADHGVPAYVWRMPANFPVEPAKGLSFSGMMTPAIDSAYGQCTLWTTDPPADSLGRESKIIAVREYNGRIDSALPGPANPFKQDGSKETLPLSIFVDHEAGAATVEIAGRALVLTPGQWSDFVRVSFSFLGGGVTKVSGTVRFHLRSITPAVELYASAINIDPLDPIEPVSAPKSASAEVARAIGIYYTQGMPEDVNALKERIITDEEFMQQSDLVHDEGVRMLANATARFTAEKDGGFLFFYFSGVDLCGHMMWRHADPEHPAHDTAFAAADSSSWSGRPASTWRDVIADLYMRMDPVVGELRAKLPADTTFVVMSDHGFASYRRKFSLNTWLVERGYLVLKPGVTKELPAESPEFKPVHIYTGDVDWTKTVAYGMGFNGLYLNRSDRERDDPETPDNEAGIVQPGREADALLARIAGELEALRDGDLRVVVRCDRASTVYNGSRTAEAPDLIVGYDVNFGNSEESSIGRIPNAVLSDNLGGTFNGSHLMAPDVVPGLLLSNRKVRSGSHSLEDLTVEILKQYGIAPAPGLNGKPVLE